MDPGPFSVGSITPYPMIHLENRSAIDYAPGVQFLWGSIFLETKDIDPLEHKPHLDKKFYCAGPSIFYMTSGIQNIENVKVLH